jgi:hypothetical protein
MVWSSPFTSDLCRNRWVITLAPFQAVIVAVKLSAVYVHT